MVERANMENAELWLDAVEKAEQSFARQFEGFNSELNANLPRLRALIEQHRQAIQQEVVNEPRGKLVKRRFKKRLNKIVTEHFSELFNHLQAERLKQLDATAQVKLEEYKRVLMAAINNLGTIKAKIESDQHYVAAWYKERAEFTMNRPPFRYYCRAAGIYICRPGSGEDVCSGHSTLCVTEHAMRLSGLFHEIVSACYHAYDHMSKYRLFESIVRAVNASKGLSEKELLLQAVIAAIDELDLWQTSLRVYRGGICLSI